MPSNESGTLKNRLHSRWDRLNSSFWFIPALLTALGILMSSLTQWLDRVLQGLIDRLPVVVSGGSSGADSVLGTIAGSLITVIATVFSLTIVTLTLVSGQYTPRLLRSFMSDRGLQVVLGTYIGTFIYSLLVLRLVSIQNGQAEQFKPTVSVAVAILLALICVGLLVYFINHVAQIIQSSSIVEMAQDDTMKVIARLRDLEEAPQEVKDPREHPGWAGLISETPSVVRARNSGYVENINLDAALSAAVVDERTRVVEISQGVGSFVAAGIPLVKVWPAAEGGPGSDVERNVNRAFVYGRERSFQQDLAFGLRQLSDIALKGLSPGINDPTTAMQALDRMEVIFIALGSKALPPLPQEREVNGMRVLVRLRYLDFDDLVGLAFDQMRRAAFASGQVAVLERLLETIEKALQTNVTRDRQRALWARSFAVARLSPDQIPDPHDAASLVLGAVKIVPALSLDVRAAVDPDLQLLAALSDDLPDGGRIREEVDALRRKVSR